MRNFFYLAAILCMGMFIGPNAYANPHDVYGVFATEEGTSHVSIDDCGDGTPCGTVIWIDPASLEEGETPETITSKSGLPVLGLVMLQGFERKKNSWQGGTIYNPPEDKSYSSKLKRLEDGTLQVKGCIGPFCQTQIWTLVEDSIAKP